MAEIEKRTLARVKGTKNVSPEVRIGINSILAVLLCISLGDTS